MCKERLSTTFSDIISPLGYDRVRGLLLKAFFPSFTHLMLSTSAPCVVRAVFSRTLHIYFRLVLCWVMCYMMTLDAHSCTCLHMGSKHLRFMQPFRFLHMRWIHCSYCFLICYECVWPGWPLALLVTVQGSSLVFRLHWFCQCRAVHLALVRKWVTC
jgi:hypothetical protein